MRAAAAPPLRWRGSEVSVLSPAAVRRVHYLNPLLGAFVFFLPVQIPIGASRYAPSDLFIVLYTILFISNIRVAARTWSIFHWGLILTFLVGTLLTGLHNGHLNSYVAMNKDAGLLLLLLTYAVITGAARSWGAMRQMLRVFIVACALHGALATISFLATKIAGHDYIPWLNYGGSRVAGMLVDPNAFGGLMAVALVIHATTFFSVEPIVRGFRGYLALAFLSLALVLTLSRSAWIGFAISLLLVMAVRPRIGVGLLATAGAGIALLFLLVGPDRATSILAIADRPNTAYQRIEQIDEAIPMLATSPFVGTGLGSFREQHGWIIHDTAIWMLTEFGVLGIIVYLGLILWYAIVGFIALSRTSGATRCLVLGLLCAHLCMLGVSVGIEAFYQRHWWLVMALLASSFALVTEKHVNTATV